MAVFSIVLAGLCTLLVPVSGYLALFAPMAMDAPDSRESTGKKLFVVALMVAPFALIWCTAQAWMQVFRGGFWPAAGWCLLGLLPLLFGWVLLRLNWLQPPKS